MVSTSQARALGLAGEAGPNGNGVNSRAVGHAIALTTVAGVAAISAPRVTWAAEASTWTWVTQVSSGNRTTTERGDGVARLKIVEGESVTFRARPTGEDGSIIYRDSVQTAMLNVFDTGIPGAGPVFSDELVVKSVMGTQLTLDKGWRSDAVGSSFKYVLPAGILVEGGRVYRAELTLRTFSDGPRSTIWMIETQPLWTSRASLGV